MVGYLSKDAMYQTKYIVIVDSRERQSTSDLEGYKEYQCSAAHFNELIVNHYNNVCIDCEVAKLCGMDIKVYFYEPLNETHTSIQMYHSHSHHHFHTNGIATSLTFNPDTGRYKHMIYGKAYVVWEDGDLPLSKRQVWGIHELIKEARKLYNHPESCSGRIDGDMAIQNDHLEATLHYKARRQLMKWCSEYQVGTWHPHWFYEPRGHCQKQRQHQNQSKLPPVKEDEDEIYVDDVSSTSSKGWDHDIEHDDKSVVLHTLYNGNVEVNTKNTSKDPDGDVTKTTSATCRLRQALFQCH